VTPVDILDQAIGLACRKDTVIFCFGDMLRVPARAESLEQVQASRGASVKMMYSPLEAFQFAQANPRKNVVLFGVGFETTIPLFAAVMIRAVEEGLHNLYLLPAFKLVPPALHALLRSKVCSIDGFILPGHVSAIIGAAAYDFLERHYHVPAVIAGFEPVDLAEGLWILLEQIRQKQANVRNEYSRFVTAEGNPGALQIMRRVFVAADASWRGLGVIPMSGLALTKEFAHLDAASLIDFSVPAAEEPTRCRCGDVIKGVVTPPECSLYKTDCSPEHPIGPCMVSSEGTCAAYYKYGK